jgi:hypothetical protein
MLATAPPSVGLSTVSAQGNGLVAQRRQTVLIPGQRVQWRANSRPRFR